MALFKKQTNDTKNNNVFEGSSIQQAVANAAQTLGVTTDQISYDVISYGSTGVFGLVGNKRAKIRVKQGRAVKEKALSATERYWREIQDEQANFASRELQKERGESPAKPARGKKNDNANGNSKPKQETKRAEPAERTDRVERTERTERVERPKTERVEKPKAETTLAEKPPRPRNNRKRGGERREVGFDAALLDIDENTPQEPLTGQLKVAYDVLQSAAEELMDTPFKIVYAVSNKKVTYVIKGDSLSPVIGKNGDTRRSLQLVADRIINKGGQSKYDVNVVVDTERKNKSKRMLTTLAKKKADLVRKSGKEESLGFLNAYERCVIHIALKKDPAVTTESRGDGAQKEIFILPHAAQN